jgi:hypothetical protein
LLGLLAALPGEFEPASAQVGDRISPALATRLEVEPGPHYVGQPIKARVLVVGEAVAPEIEPPTTPDLEVVPGERGFRPIAVTGIGNKVTETNRFLRDFILVPRRGGRLTIPPFRARAGARTGTTTPAQIEPRLPPPAGRPPGFLGGIGRLEVIARLVPESVRLGEPARLEIRLRGPGAFGSTTRPILTGLGKVPLGLKVAPAGAEWSPQSAERSWFYTVRASRSGMGKLPPVVVATFEPARHGYSTYISTSPTLRVAAPVLFQEGKIEQPPEPLGKPAPALGRIAAALLAGLLVLAAAILTFRWARGPAAFARGMARKLERATEREIAELGAKALAGYLARVVGWPGGELTAEEARRGVEEATGRADLASEAARFVDEIDRRRFGGPGVGAGALRSAGASLLRKLARSGGRRVGPRWRESQELKLS